MPTASASTSNIADLALQMKKDEQKEELGGGSLSKASSSNKLFGNFTKKRDSIGNRFFKDLPILDKKSSQSKDTTNVPSASQSTTGSPKETMIQYLLSKKVNVNARDSYGSTPLHYAVAKGNIPAVQELLKHPGVDIEVCELLE